jgi:hypothetical protein
MPYLRTTTIVNAFCNEEHDPSTISIPTPKASTCGLLALKESSPNCLCKHVGFAGACWGALQLGCTPVRSIVTLSTPLSL